jgi:DNA (cytosine-5)-methyltransferase 1
MTPKLKAVDLFCGAGGFTLGLSRAGFEVLGAVDSWDIAVDSYRRNFAHKVILSPIENLSPAEFLSTIGAEVGDIDLVVGGPPCQGFSVQRIGHDSDERNDLILEFARFVAGIAPRIFVMENVPGLHGKRGRKIADELVSRLSLSGYRVKSRIVNAAEYGVPQSRRRLFYYGWKRDAAPFSFPLPICDEQHFRTVQDAFFGLLEPSEDCLVSSSDPLHRRTRLSPLNVQRLRLIPPGGGFEDLPPELRVACHRNGADKIGHRYVYGRLAANKPAGTITARFDSFTRGKFAHPIAHRNITLREGARLQTFPDDFVFRGTQEEIAALIGNAVPPALAEQVCNAVSCYLKANRGFSPAEHEPGTNAQPTLFSGASPSR